MQKTIRRRSTTMKYFDVDGLIRSLSKGGNQAKEMAQDLLTKSIKTAKHRSLSTHRRLAHYTYKNPMKSLGVAAVTGAILGYMMNKLRNDRW